MRHRKKGNPLGRKKAHAESLMSNMAASLIFHKRLSTTLAKARALRTYVEPIITRSRKDTTHSRRMVFRHLQNKNAVAALFRDVAPKVAERPGGYTRILKTGFRTGDGADMCFIELVDFNQTMLNVPAEKKEEKGKRTRRRRKKAEPQASAPAANNEQAPAEESENKNEKKRE